MANPFTARDLSENAADNAAAFEAVQRAVALVRNATRKLRDPMPVGNSSVTDSFLTSLLTPGRQQKTLLEFNPLDSQSFAKITLAELATQAAKQVAQPPKSRTVEQDNFIKAVVAATAKAGKKSLASAIAGQSVSHAVTAIASKAAPQKFSLVKPSLQDVNAQLIDMWDKISQASSSPELKKIAEINTTNLRQINNAIAPRAAAGRSTGATLGKLLQKIEALADDGIVGLVQGPGISGLVEQAAGSPGLAPEPPAALAKLAEIIGDVWGQTSPSSAAQQKSPAMAKRQKAAVTPASKTDTSAEEKNSTSMLNDILRAFTPTAPVATVSTNTGAANASSAPLDVYAIADGLNDVLREQAWLAGVDLT